MSRPAIRTTAGIGRFELIAMLSMVMALTALGIDLMLPAFGEMRAAFGLAADSNEVAGIVTAYVFGLAGGTLLFGPLSDRFGRKPAIYIGLAVYGLASIGAALAPSLELLIASRVVWGVGAAGPRIVSVSIIRDLYQGEQMAKVMSFIFALFILVPILAPSLGALIIAVAPWHWLFWATAIWAGLLGLWLVRLGETMDPANRIELSAHDLWRATRFVLGNRQTLGYAVALTIGFGAFVSYLATSQLIFSDIFDKADLFPFIFGGLAAGMGVAMLANAFLVERYGVRRLIRLTLVVFITASAGLLGLALGSGGPPPLWAFLAGLASCWRCKACSSPT